MHSSTGGVLLMICIYFLPAIVAFSNKHRNKAGITLINLILGWTVVGRVVALIMATWKDK